MNRESILAAMNEINDHWLLEARQSAAKKQISRPIRFTLLAACLCALLAGTVAAVTPGHRVSVSPPVSVTRPDENVISYIDISTPITKIPLSALSDETMQFLSRQMSLPAETEADHWTSAEEFLGLDLANSPLLDEMGPVSIRFTGRCDAPTFIDLYLSSLWQSGSLQNETILTTPCTQVLLRGTLSTEAMLDSVTEDRHTAYFQGTASVTTEEITTASGLTAVTAALPEGGGYRVWFAQGCVHWYISISSSEGEPAARDTLLQVLNSFQ